MQASRLCYIAMWFSTFYGSLQLSSVAKNTEEKLQLWEFLSMVYSYAIHDTSCDANVWVDLFSRWGSSMQQICAIRQIPLKHTPILKPEFVWPTVEEVHVAQADATVSSLVNLEFDCDGLFHHSNGALWITADASSLQLVEILYPPRCSDIGR
ncbi:hypothetical protein PsorP6_017647 [Peronosclerospora sorghi]|uniref:Uncharacterized protein n=1 Tax=Peronosclerospora sorghi TaxID=230839 RepID=A0ACC0WND7_9STRA|nr:hypothetical protein PsorP6_017647 [Peronosclerospora sorghi]